MINVANPPNQVAARETAAYCGAGEPHLAELYRDPLLHAVLRRDGIDLPKLQALVAATQKRLSAAA